MLNTIFSFDTLWIVLMIIYVPACLGLITIVLLQKGKGTGFAGAFGMGGGGGDTVFGPKSSQSLPVKLTYIAAAAFMVIALLMSIIAGKVGKGQAPELLEVTEGDIAAVSGLDDIGIGRSSVAGIDTSGNEDEADGTVAPDSGAEISDATDLDDLSTEDEAAGTEEQSDSADSPDAP